VKVNASGWLEAVARDRGRGIFISDLTSTYNLGEIILVALTARELNFDEFKMGGLH
jgi:hypothetical protein